MTNDLPLRVDSHTLAYANSFGVSFRGTHFEDFAWTLTMDEVRKLNDWLSKVLEKYSE